MHKDFDIDVRLHRLDPVTKRHPRTEQRRIANALQEGVTGVLVSRSHSRGIVVVASANAPTVRLGIDVEYLDPVRPWSEIAAMFVPAANVAGLGAPDDACRLWTFGEAYLKAFGKLPASELFMLAARSAAGRGGQIHWRSERLPDDFWLTLVWETEP